jgi:hypothetical protein
MKFSMEVGHKPANKLCITSHTSSADQGLSRDPFRDITHILENFV